MDKHIVIIGGQRCGTTYLLNLFSLFKIYQITKTIFPEPKYFLNNEINYKEYKENYFDHNNSNLNLIFVEKSTSYYENPKAIEKINLTFNDYLIIFLIRDPIKRAISNYSFSKENNIEKLGINEAFKREMYTNQESRKYNESTDPLNYLQRSKYLEKIQFIEKIIYPNKIFLFNSEELFSNPKKIFERLHQIDYFQTVNLKEDKLLQQLPVKKLNYTLNNNLSICLENEIIANLKRYFYEEYYLLPKKYKLDKNLWEYW